MEDINKIKITKRTPYNVLNINIIKEFFDKTAEEIDAIILRKKEALLKICTDMLEKTDNFREKKRIELEIQRIEEAYEFIKTAEKREEYDFKLIANRQKQESENLTNKMVMKKPIQSREHFYMDKENRQLRVKQTGQIIYMNWQGMHSSINEYQVSRKINGEERADTVYTNLSMAKLSKDIDTKKICDFNYYECVVNELLSENAIECSKYNYGYIGEVDQDENGKYVVTLKDKNLKKHQKEQLTAIMILRKQENEIQIEGNEI